MNPEKRVAPGDAIYNLAIELMREGKCGSCGKDLSIFHGYHHYDKRISDCGHVICKECGTGVIVTKMGMLFYYENDVFIRGGNDRREVDFLYDIVLRKC